MITIKLHKTPASPSGMYKTLNKRGERISMFRYVVTGNAEELADYAASKGDFDRVDTEEGSPTKGQHLYFSNNFIGNSAQLTKSQKGNWFPETSNTDKLADIAKQYPAFAAEAARQAIANLMGGASVATNIAVETPSEESIDKV